MARKPRNWPTTVTIAGKRWRLVVVSPSRLPVHKDNHGPIGGDCDSPRLIGKRIRINSRIRGENLLRVVIHEFMHAGGWQLSEEAVDNMSTDFARALWKMGLRWSWESDHTIDE
jgi:hypothetical protein